MSTGVRDYYRRLVDAAHIGEVCRKLIPNRITTESATKLRIDCPHHQSQSKTSLHVSLERGLWHCFGCGVGGDVIQLVEFTHFGKVTKCSRDGVTDTHRAARDELARWAGIPPPTSFSQTSWEGEYAEARGTFEAMTAIVDSYHERLVSPDNAHVLDWFEKKYGITKQTIDALKIGWSGTEPCLSDLIAKGIREQDLKSTGFFRFRSFPTEVRQYFKNRIVFPYWSRGQVVYAIGRRTPWTPSSEYEKAKYKKLPLHNDKKLSFISPAIVNPALFGADILREQPREVILTEGIADAVAVQQAGFPCVSPVTVRLKGEEVALVAGILKGVERVYIIQDNELSRAGLDGALATADALEGHGIACRLVEIPLSAECALAREELVGLLGEDGSQRFLGSKSSSQRKVLGELLGEDQEQIERANVLIQRSKIDLCDFLRDNPGRDSLDALIRRATRPIEAGIDGIQLDSDEDRLLESIEPLLVRILREPAPIQSELFSRLRDRTGKRWKVSDLKAAARAARGKSAGAQIARAKGAAGQFECNDNFLGDEFGRGHGVDVRYCAQTSRWAIWRGTHWKWDEDRSIEQLARSTVERIGRQAEEMAALAAKGGDVEQAAMFGRFARRALSMHGVRAALDVAGGTYRMDDGGSLCLPIAEFDPYHSTKFLINCRSGVLDLRTRSLAPHAKSKVLHITKLAPVEYRAEAECPEFLSSLWSIFEGDRDAARASRLIELLQVGLGYSLLGDQSHHLLFLLYGPEGRNGKSLIVGIVQSVLGADYAGTAPPGLLRQKRGETHPTELADLNGKRFVSTIETSRSDKLDEALVKHLTGGDAVKARRMREDFSEFQPTHHLWIATNNLPKADAADSALWARIRILPFRRRFLKPEDHGFETSPLVYRADDNLACRILGSEREGVFAWMVEGCRRYLETGAVPNPPESREEVSEYRRSNDPVGDWIAELCETTGSGTADRAELPDEWWTASALLYLSFKGWSEARGARPPSDNGLARCLTEKGFPSRRERGGQARGRCGIRLLALSASGTATTAGWPEQ